MRSWLIRPSSLLGCSLLRQWSILRGSFLCPFRLLGSRMLSFPWRSLVSRFARLSLDALDLTLSWSHSAMISLSHLLGLLLSSTNSWARESLFRSRLSRAQLTLETRFSCFQREEFMASKRLRFMERVSNKGRRVRLLGWISQMPKLEMFPIRLYLLRRSSLSISRRQSRPIYYASLTSLLMEFRRDFKWI